MTAAAMPLPTDTPGTGPAVSMPQESESLAVARLLSVDEIRLLSALGFMAARSGHVVPAIRIFEGLAVLRKDKAFPYVGLALAMICIGAYGDAANVLRERGMEACPDDPEILAYLGLALQLAGRTSEAALMTRDLETRAELPAALQELVNKVAGLADGTDVDRPRPAPVTTSTSKSTAGE